MITLNVSWSWVLCNRNQNVLPYYYYLIIISVFFCIFPNKSFYLSIIFLSVPSLQEEGEFISTVFSQPKKNDSFLNLKELNAFVHYQHFKINTLDTLDTLDSCINLMTPGCYMASLHTSLYQLLSSVKIS